MVVFYQGGLSAGGLFIGVVFHHDGLLLGWSFNRASFLRVVFHQGG